MARTAAVLLLGTALLISIGARPLRGQSSQEDARARAERLTAEAAVLSDRGDAASLKQALRLRQDALVLWTELGDRRRQADLHHGLGHIYHALGQLSPALDAFLRALPMRREVLDVPGEAETLTRLGAVYRLSGDPKRALDAYTRALELRRQSGDVRGEGATLHNLGSLYWTTGDYTRALDAYTHAMRARDAAGDRRGASETLIGLAVTYRMLDDSTTALDLYQQAIVLKREVGDRRGEALALHNLGVLYSTLGDVPRAIEYYHQSLALSREIGERQTASSTLTSLGIGHRLLGEPHKAIAYHEQALVIQQELKNVSDLASTLSNLGVSHEQIGDYPAARRAYERALPLNRQAGDRRGEAFTLLSMAVTDLKTGDLEKGQSLLEDARRIQQEIGDANSEAETLLEMAGLAARAGRLDQALERLDAGLEIIESVRARVAVPALRATYPGLKQSHYTLKIDLLMRLHAEKPSAGYAEQAFLASERRQARTLLEMIDRARVGTPADGALAARERQLRADLSRRANARLTAAASVVPRLEQETEALLREYDLLQAEINAANREHASLTRSLERVGDLQRHLGPDTALLEYSLGPERSFAWVVTQEAFHAFVLPGGERIEGAARRYFDLITTTPQRALRVRRSQAAAELSQLVLAPVRQALTRKRLVIVNDGALHYVPFAALPDPAGSDPAGPPNHLLIRYEIVQLPSAGVLGALRAAERPRASKSVAVFADPVFGPGDPRVRGVAPVRGGSGLKPVVRGGQSDTLVKALVDVELSTLDRLEASAREADAILALTPKNTALKAIGFDAQRTTALSPSLGDYRVVHFATHGLLNSRRPELSGIMLSTIDAHGRPQDGYLTMADVLSLRLRAELVVLSACRTALGREIKGEGLIGLTRAFMYGGVPRVVASLWDVQDNSSAELMARFYRGVLTQRRSPAAALRAAQLAMRTDPRWAEPHYWAAFTLQGDWLAY